MATKPFLKVAEIATESSGVVITPISPIEFSGLEPASTKSIPISFTSTLATGSKITFVVSVRGRKSPSAAWSAPDLLEFVVKI